MWSGEVTWSAKDQASDVVGLAGGADELFDAFHQVTEVFPGRKISARSRITLSQARVGKFLARGIECFDDAVGEENESVAGLQDRRKRWEKWLPE